MKDFSDEELLRYSRQIMLPQLDIQGQQRISASRVLVVGAGGLGSPAAMYLAVAGVKQLVIMDADKVELSNLQRQIIHQTESVGKTKVESAQQTLQALNPLVVVTPLAQKAQASNLGQVLESVDIVLDCTDNFTVRFLLNKLCFKYSLPLVSAAAIRFEGQISVFDFRDKGSPCYHCLYGDQGEEDMSCARNGVLAPLVGVMGAMQAMEALKLIAAIGKSLQGKLLLFDGLAGQWRTLKLPKDPECPVCADP